MPMFDRAIGGSEPAGPGSISEPLPVLVSVPTWVSVLAAGAWWLSVLTLPFALGNVYGYLSALCDVGASMPVLCPVARKAGGAETAEAAPGRQAKQAAGDAPQARAVDLFQGHLRTQGVE